MAPVELPLELKVRILRKLEMHHDGRMVLEMASSGSSWAEAARTVYWESVNIGNLMYRNQLAGMREFMDEGWRYVQRIVDDCSVSPADASPLFHTTYPRLRQLVVVPRPTLFQSGHFLEFLWLNQRLISEVHVYGHWRACMVIGRNPRRRIVCLRDIVRMLWIATFSNLRTLVFNVTIRAEQFTMLLKLHPLLELLSIYRLILDNVDDFLSNGPATSLLPPCSNYLKSFRIGRIIVINYPSVASPSPGNDDGGCDSNSAPAAATERHVLEALELFTPLTKPAIFPCLEKLTCGNVEDPSLPTLRRHDHYFRIFIFSTPLSRLSRLQVFHLHPQQARMVTVSAPNIECLILEYNRCQQHMQVLTQATKILLSGLSRLKYLQLRAREMIHDNTIIPNSLFVHENAPFDYGAADAAGIIYPFACKDLRVVEASTFAFESISVLNHLSQFRHLEMLSIDMGVLASTAQWPSYGAGIGSASFPELVYFELGGSGQIVFSSHEVSAMLRLFPCLRFFNPSAAKVSVDQLRRDFPYITLYNARHLFIEFPKVFF
ncbi:hypothetical protein EV182_003400 [Spiromyces aspiralis]|uniref:Uncharacterized protein n=1 Tax=Spiromyces aspiralis TaxID=68401 RepID=A0ACC1HQE5_9FUNG|nr:hypothetical protein EV182_003400 [Spiromyces aspiralis]